MEKIVNAISQPVIIRNVVNVVCSKLKLREISDLVDCIKGSPDQIREATFSFIRPSWQLPRPLFTRS